MTDFSFSITEKSGLLPASNDAQALQPQPSPSPLAQSTIFAALLAICAEMFFGPSISIPVWAAFAADITAFSISL